MRLMNITARAHPAGNRIDLAWTNPEGSQFPGVRVVRREGTHPLTPDDGKRVAHGLGLSSFSDTGLRGETVYYYTLFPFKGDPPVFEADIHNRAAALATSPYDFAGLMYSLIPALYHRYDDSRLPSPGTVAPEDQGKGELRRFLDLPGSQFDQLYSRARAALELHDVDRVDGRLLPLLAQWIGWQTGYNLELSAQRNEIRFAPRIYQTVGIIPTIEATVKRISGWESRTKEFVHNVAITNQPERLNLWSMIRGTDGAWGKPSLASLNYVFEGRPAAVKEADGSLSFFYHTYRRHGWDIWTKRFSAAQWQPSQPVVDQPGADKHPAAAMQGTRLWLFWETFDPGEDGSKGNWSIAFRTRSAGVWSDIAVFGDTATERRLPAAAADNNGGVWLFWLERSGNGWQVKYNRHDGAAWRPAAASFPLDGADDPRVENDPILFFHPSNAAKPLWLFWARHEAEAAGGRWTIAYRFKQGLDPAVSDWSPVATLPKTPGDYHDREPAVVPAGNDVEMFWSSNRNGSWSVWNGTLATGPMTWSGAVSVAGGPYSLRAPLAADTGNGMLLTFRSNQSLEYASTVYGATRTLDERCAGTSTVDTRNKAKLALRGAFEDFLTYTCEAGRDGKRGNDDRIARDTIGIYLTPGTADPAQIRATISRIGDVLTDFMPVAERAVFIITP